MAKPDFQLKWGVNRVGGIPATDPADYQLGWQYRAGLPPLTGNFDYFQNLADERLLYLNAQGVSEWDALTAYDTDAYVKGSDGELYRSNAPTTGNDPTLGGPWALAISDTLNTLRQDLASAATTALPATTRHVNITGTATITAFTAVAGTCYFVRFAGTATLTNNASIVTQRSVDIVTAAGDTCIIRATATDVVEVLFYTRSNPGGDFVYGSNANGEYRISPDGFIEQWARINFPAGGGVWTFPVAFNSPPALALANNSQAGATISNSAFVATGEKTSTTMFVKLFANETTGKAGNALVYVGGY